MFCSRSLCLLSEVVGLHLLSFYVAEFPVNSSEFSTEFYNVSRIRVILLRF